VTIPAIAAAAVALLAACTQAGPVATTADGRLPTARDDASITRVEDVMQVAGVMHFVEVERGAWVIRTSDGIQYLPLDLPEAFRVEGLPVDAQLRSREDIATTAMVGRPVEVVSIERTAPADADNAGGAR
jgi:hypothetical protein